MLRGLHLANIDPIRAGIIACGWGKRKRMVEALRSVSNRARRKAGHSGTRRGIAGIGAGAEKILIAIELRANNLEISWLQL